MALTCASEECAIKRASHTGIALARAAVVVGIAERTRLRASAVSLKIITFRVVAVARRDSRITVIR